MIRRDAATRINLSKRHSVRISRRLTTCDELSAKHIKILKMPCCAILSCRIRSNELKEAPGVVAFHRFPPDPQLKEKWIQTTGRKDWIPTKSSTICSKHFIESDYIPMNTKRRYLKSGAIPTQEINRLVAQVEVEEGKVASEPSCTSATPSTSTQKRASTTDTSNVLSCKRKKMVLPLSNSSTPRKRRLQNIIVTKNSVIEKQKRKIRALQARNRRLKKKVVRLEYNLKELEDKFPFRQDEMVAVESTNVKAEIEQIFICNQVTNQVHDKD